MPNDETVVALATPTGESAIALLRLSGPRCRELVRELFGKAGPLPRRSYLGHYRDRADRLIDQVVFTYYQKGASYTGERVLEIATHGNPFIAQSILQDLCQRGCRLAAPGEFTRTAFLNGRIDLSQAEAVMDLIRARSEAALEAANRQLSGSVRNTVNTLMEKILHVLTEVEVYIDFPEEDLPDEETCGPTLDLTEVSREMDHLLAGGHLASLLHDGVRVVITGPPNAGKSSLLNALVGADRVIVSEEPGTTRDYVEERITLGPYVLRLVDTAGIGETKSPIESQGMRKAIDQVDRSHLVLCVVDTTEPAPNLPDGVAKRLSEKAAIVIENKTDRVESQEHLEWLPHLSHLRLSALTGDGLDSLIRLFRTRLEEKIPSAENERVLVNARHAQALKEAKHGLKNALGKMRRGSYNELIASDLRISLAALGEITGKVDNEAMLDALFGKFCIGK